MGQNENAKRFYQELLANNPTPIDYFNYGAFLLAARFLLKGISILDIDLILINENYKSANFAGGEKMGFLETDISDKTFVCAL